MTPARIAPGQPQPLLILLCASQEIRLARKPFWDRGRVGSSWKKSV